MRSNDANSAKDLSNLILNEYNFLTFLILNANCNSFVFLFCNDFDIVVNFSIYCLNQSIKFKIIFKGFRVVENSKLAIVCNLNSFVESFKDVTRCSKIVTHE